MAETSTQRAATPAAAVRTKEPSRRVIATFDNYAGAEQAVDYLSDQKFAVERVAIVGRELTLVEQVTGRVRWRESIAWLVESGGVTRFAEAGAGKVLSGMAKRIAPDAEASPLNTPADLEAFAKSL